MKIGIVCNASQHYHLICESFNCSSQIIEDGIDFRIGKLQSKEVVLTNFSKNDQALIEILKTKFDVKLIIFLGLSSSCLTYLKSGDLMVINEVVDNKGQLEEKSYLADSRSIDNAFKIVENLDSDFTVKAVVGKIYYNENSSSDNCFLTEADDTVYCWDRDSVQQAKTCLNYGIPFFMLKILIDHDNQQLELEQSEFAEKYNHAFWLLKGVIEQS